MERLIFIPFLIKDSVVHNQSKVKHFIFTDVESESYLLRLNIQKGNQWESSWGKVCHWMND